MPDHAPTLHKLTKETAKLLNRPFKGLKGVLTKAGDAVQKGGKAVNKGGQRFANVFATPLEFTTVQSYKPPVFPKSEETQAFLFEALQHNFVFQDLSLRELKPLIMAMEKFDVEKGTTIIQQGDIGDYFYVLEQGQVSIRVDNKLVGKPLVRGASFGELALLYQAPRAATVTASDHATLYRVDQKTFRLINQAHAHSAGARKMELLSKVDFLAHLSPPEQQKLADSMTIHIFSKGDYLQTKGKEAHKFWLIDKGSVLMTDLTVGGKALADITVEAGDHFGQHALMSGQPLFGNAIAQADGRAFCISKEEFVHVLGDNTKALARSLGRRGLASVKVLHDTKLSTRMLDSLVTYIKTVECQEGDAVMRLGHHTEAALYFLRKGSVHVKSATTDETMTEVGMFGDELLLLDAKTHKNGPNDTTQVTAPYTVTVTSETCELGMLRLKDCRKVFDTRYMGKGLPNKEDSIMSMRSVSVKDFTRHTILGAGTFGQVWLVSRTDSQNDTKVYALKIQSKYELVKNSQAKGVVHEKQIMAQLHHPFVANLVAAFKDDKFVYMLMDLVQGGELEGIMHTETSDQLSDHDAAFYSAGIVEGLSYMHRLGYVYRDLKPQNVLISNEGYPVIADFGFAKYVSTKTFTFCGTPLYLAPEIILNRVHNWGADHWSLGVLIFEMLTGYTPFYEDHMDQMELFRAIVQDRVHYPNHIKPEAKAYIQGLLVKKPSRRLGSGEGGIDDLFTQPWFKKVDFAKLRHMEYKAPFVPKIGNPLDTSNFEDWSGMEDKMHSKYPPLNASDESIFDQF